MKECIIMYSVMCSNWVISVNGHFEHTENFDTTEQAIISAYRQGFTNIHIQE